MTSWHARLNKESDRNGELYEANRYGTYPQKKSHNEPNKTNTTIMKQNIEVYDSNFKDNILTLFNLLNLLIGVCLLAVGAYSNLFYLVIILINITVGISQEIHARNLVKNSRSSPNKKYV